MECGWRPAGGGGQEAGGGRMACRQRPGGIWHREERKIEREERREKREENHHEQQKGLATDRNRQKRSEKSVHNKQTTAETIRNISLFNPIAHCTGLPLILGVASKRARNLFFRTTLKKIVFP